MRTGNRFAVKDIYDANDQKRFFNKLVAKHPKPMRKTKRWTICANTSVSETERGKQKTKKPNRPTSDGRNLFQRTPMCCLQWDSQRHPARTSQT